MSAHRSSLFGQQRAKPGVSAYRADRDMESELQHENDHLVESVSVDMARLKTAAQTLRDEAADHNRLLDALQNTFTNAKDGIKGTVGKLDGVMARYGCKDTMSCAAILFIVLMLIYFILRRMSAANTGANSSGSGGGGA